MIVTLNGLIYKIEQVAKSPLHQAEVKEREVSVPGIDRPHTISNLDTGKLLFNEMVPYVR